ncbi:MAG: GNAT family N-acetyltransferase [Vulcanimicrobiota bacterium]
MPRPDPKETIEDLRRLRFPEAAAVFLAGSVVRGQGTSYSDLDVVVVLDTLSAAYRESLVHQDWPVELFVHDPETLAYFFESDRKRGVPSLAAMVSEGLELPASTALSSQLKHSAQKLLQAGPPVWTRPERDAARYAVTDVCDDLRAPRSQTEALASGARLYEMLANFALRAAGRWSATGKSIPTQLEKLQTGLAEGYTSAFEQLFNQRESSQLLRLAENLLEPYGGWLFEESPRPAPAHWRLRRPPKFETPRLILRMGEERDISSILRYLRGNQARLAPLEPERPVDFYTVDYWRDYLGWARQEFSHETALRLIITPRQKEDVIGMINFSQMFRGPFQACYLGYSLDLEWEGQAIMYEALQVALKYVFEELGFHRVMANYMPENERSGRLLKRLGFVVEGRASDYLQIGGVWRDHVLTSLTRPA